MLAATRFLLLGIASVALYLINDRLQHVLLSSNLHPVSVLADVTAVHAGNSPSLDWELAGYVAVNVGVFWIYAQVIAMCRRDELQGRVRTWAFAVPILTNLSLLMTAPSLSQDIYSYMAHGYLAQMSGGNPLLQPAYAVGGTAFGDDLASHGWHGRVSITPYGILWTRLEMLLVRLAHDDIVTAMIYFKALVVAVSFGCARLIWLLLGYIRPQVRLLGTLMYLWNPLVIVEIAGEGHNDAVMLAFALVALWACAAGKPGTSLIAAALGVITKYVPVLFGLAQWVFLWRNRRSTRRLAIALLAAGVTSSLIAAMLYAPLWSGLGSFTGIVHRAEPSFSASPIGGLKWLLRLGGWSTTWSSRVAALLCVLPAIAVIIWSSLRVKDIVSLAEAFAWIALIYVVLASPDFWPWYSLMPIALLAVAQPTCSWWLVMMMALAGRFTAPLNVLYDEGYISVATARGAITGLGTTLPLFIIVTWVIRRRLAHAQTRPAAV